MGMELVVALVQSIQALETPLWWMTGALLALAGAALWREARQR